MAGLGQQQLLEDITVRSQCYPTHLKYQNYLQSSSWSHVDRCCIAHQSFSEDVHIPLPTEDTCDPKRDTVCTDSEIDDEETRSTDQQQGTVDVTQHPT